MYKLSLLFITALLTLSAAYESKAVDEEFCAHIADIAYTVAKERDKGISKREVRHRVITNDNGDGLAKLILIIVDTVYERPWASPDKEADVLERECSFYIEPKQRS